MSAKFFGDLHQLFDGYSRKHGNAVVAAPNEDAPKAAEKVVKHKTKEKEKSEKKEAKAVAQSHPEEEVKKPDEKKALETPTKTPTKKEKKEKKPKKDPEIKKPLSAYMLYNNFRRPKLREQYPRTSLCSADPFIDISLPDISRLIGEEWKTLAEEHKQVSGMCHL